MKPGPGVSAGLLAGRAALWSLGTAPRDARGGVRSLRAWGALTHLGTGCPEACVGLLVGIASP